MKVPTVWKYRLDTSYNDGSIKYENHTSIKSARFSITCSKGLYKYDEEFVNRKVRPISYAIINTRDNSIIYEYFVNIPKTSNKNMINNLDTVSVKTKSYWVLVVYKIDKTHPDVITVDELAEVVDLLDRYVTTEYDYMEIHYVTNHKARLFADIKSDGVRVYLPFADIIDWKIEND